MKQNLALEIFNNFSTNMFGIIGGNNIVARNSSNAGFIPLDGSGKTLPLQGSEAIWMGMRSREQQKRAYMLCFPLASVIDRLAEYDLTGQLEIYRLGGKGAEDPATNPWSTSMRNLLEQPNPLQSWEQFRGQQLVYKRIFGFCPVFPIIPAGFEGAPENAVSIINIPPWLFEPVSTGKLLNQSKLNEIVKQYDVTILGQSFTLTSDQIFILADSFMQDEERSFLVPLSKLVGLDMPISNLCAAEEADNVLLRKRGPLGFISHDAAATKDSVAGYIPMTSKEREELQESLSHYGMSWNQYQWVISRQAVKWNPTSFDVKALGTKETIIASEKAICHRYGFPYVLYEETDATYANGGNAAVSVYQNNVIPNANRDMREYNKFFKAKAANSEICIEFDHLPVLQEDRLNTEQANKAQDESLQIEWLNNLITLNEWRQARGYELITDETGEMRYKDIAQQAAEHAASLIPQPNDDSGKDPSETDPATN